MSLFIAKTFFIPLRAWGAYCSKINLVSIRSDGGKTSLQTYISSNRHCARDVLLRFSSIMMFGVQLVRFAGLKIPKIASRIKCNRLLFLLLLRQQCDQIWRNFATFGLLSQFLRILLVLGKFFYLLWLFSCY